MTNYSIRALIIAGGAVLIATACATTPPSAYNRSADRVTTPQAPLLAYDEAADRANPNMRPDTAEEIEDQNAALVLVRETSAIRDKPQAEVSLNDLSRLRSIDTELKTMRLKYLTRGDSADHLSVLGLDEAMKSGK